MNTHTAAITAISTGTKMYGLLMNASYTRKLTVRLVAAKDVDVYKRQIHKALAGLDQVSIIK